ncbi:MAG: alanine dehydrogenase [Methylovulum sp.]|nr:alanine dehydrogenase [Methylovulum sp.]
MKIGVPKEIKDQEGRVAVTPAGILHLIQQGHAVVVEVDAGVASGFANEQYEQAGARLVSAAEAWAADLVVKVKEPIASEYHYLDGQLVFTFFHLAGVDPALTVALLASATTAIAYETLEDSYGRLPILAPMSAVAGNMATLMGSYYLAGFNGGKGVQLGRVVGKRHGKVVVVGDGVVGQHAAQVACGMGANVFVAGIDTAFMQNIQTTVLPEATFFLSTSEAIGTHLLDADLVVGAILCRGAQAPKVISEAMVASLAAGSVVVDVSIDQGGCIATSRPTSHSDPVFVKHGVVHYCVTNMPGAYPRTSTIALMDATLPYILKIADIGKDGLKHDKELMTAVNTLDGVITCRAVADALGMADKYAPIID